MSSGEKIRIPRGTVDLRDEALGRVMAVEAAAREVFGRFGYREIRFPVFEETRLFARAIGEATDVVEKEMFSIQKGSRSYSLRPEGTASVVRHYVENKLHGSAPFQKLFYVGPMFRYERPQAGRQRQFQQVGIEAFGSLDPRLDAEVIVALDRFFRSLGMEGQEVRLNTIGCHDCRPAYRVELADALRPRTDELCEDCVRRLDRNVLRVLDCKKPGCRALTAGLRPLPEMVCGECRDHFEAVKTGLAGAGIVFETDPFLVRGLDYYTRTVFEAVHPALGAQDSICGGGRYDGLVEELGGPATPAVGFAVGVERTLLALEALEAAPALVVAGPDAWVVPVKPECREDAFALLLSLRDAGLAADMDFEGRGMKSQMKKAGRASARYALLLGPGEIERGVVTLRHMESGEQEEVARDFVAEKLTVSGTQPGI